ncbi:hypothetical protein ACFQ14_07975 [Pseudahrensia aquimaris]|uniref:Uncharacterized protein n=1 Tax=Pseudahrensia aquimaris TaxID=744461 RepID=A0ABW3FEI5_9HYPH
MPEFETDKARGGRETKNNWALRILIVSLVLVAGAWYFTDWFVS